MKKCGILSDVIYGLHAQRINVLMVYCVCFQQVIGMLSGPVTTSFIIQTCVCAVDDQQFLAQLIGLSVFMSGICTVIQVTIGIRQALSHD